MPTKHSRPGPMARFFNRLLTLFGNNIARTIIILLFVYLVFSYLSLSNNVESYVVTSGPLSRNETYTAISLREEQVITAPASGYVRYYAKEGDKINANGVVAGISTEKADTSEITLSKNDLSKIRSDMMSFSKTFSGSNFNSIYSFKYQIEGNIYQYAVTSSTNETPEAASMQDVSTETEGAQKQEANQNAALYAGQTLAYSDVDGIVLYSRDDYTGFTAEDLSLDDFSQNLYHETDLKTDQMISTGNDMYTIITNEKWSIVIPLTDRQARRLSDRSTVRVKFLKDGMTQSGDLEIIEIDGQSCAKIDFNKGLVRYATDRYLEVELVTNTVTGLKIPLTSIVTKEFYVIPESYAATSEYGVNNQLIVKRAGETETETVTPTIYATIPQDTDADIDNLNVNAENNIYVDMSKFNEGDEIIPPPEKNESSDSSVEDENPDSSEADESLDSSPKESYIIGETDTLQGVYCINQGYTVFTRIEIIDQNDEYAIVSKSTSYGLAKYDRILRDAKNMNESDMLY